MDGAGRVQRVVRDLLSIRPQFVLAQIDVVIPRNAIAPGIDMHRSEEGRIREQAELGAGEERFTVVGPLLAIPKTDE
jgi:hypothetical protein